MVVQEVQAVINGGTEDIRYLTGLSFRETSGAGLALATVKVRRDTVAGDIIVSFNLDDRGMHVHEWTHPINMYNERIYTEVSVSGGATVEGQYYVMPSRNTS